MNTTSDTGYGSKDAQYFSYRREEMLAFVPASARRVLELGCGQALFAQALKASRPGLHVTGIEAYASAVEETRARVDRLLPMGIEDALPLLRGERFDCLICNDVLEHLVDPWAVLRAVRPLLVPGGHLVVSLPNLRYLPVFKDYVLRGRFRYQDDGVLDRTHLRFFTREGMRELIEACGYAVVQQRGINAIGVSWKFRALNALARGRLGDTPYKQFACVACVRP